MINLLLIVLLALFALLAVFVWWRFDVDLSDLVASSVTPAVGLGLIYYYGTPLAWAGGLFLLAIGGFAFAYLVKRRGRPLSPHRQQKQTPKQK